MGGFWDDFETGFETPFKWTYDKFNKADSVADRALDGAGNLATGLTDLLSGNSNILLYVVIGVVAVAVLPTVLEKAL